MCTGAEGYLAAAALAASAAGTAYSVNAQKKTRRATEAAAVNQMQKQEKVEREANALFQDELANSDAGTAQQQAEAEAAASLDEANRLVDRENTGFTSAAETTGLATDSSPVVKATAARGLADALSRAEAQMKARSVLQGMGLRNQQRARQFGRAGEQLGFLQNANQGWQNVGQVQQQMAQFAGQKDALLGDVLTGLGQMGTAYAGAKASTPTTTPTATQNAADVAAYNNRQGPGYVIPTTYGR